MIKYISLIIVIVSAIKMYLFWDSALFDAWCVGFTGWINVFIYELEKEKKNIANVA